MKTNRFAQIATLSAGLIYLFVALSMMAVPRWFFDIFGEFPPFNRHYMGDLGSFLLPLAIGLIIAARDPYRYRIVIGIGAVASLIHIFNHAYDAIFEHVTNANLLIDFSQLILLAAVLFIAYFRPAKIQSQAPETEENDAEFISV